MGERLALDTMASALPAPYRKGAERLGLTLSPEDGTGASFGFEAYDFDAFRARYGHDPLVPRCVVFPLDDVEHVPVALSLTFDAGAQTRRLAAAVGLADVTLTLDQPLPLGPLPADIQVGTEIVRVSAAAGATLTVERGRPGGVPAEPHPAGTTVRRRQAAASPIELTAPVGLKAKESLALPAGALGPDARLLTLATDPPGAVSAVSGWGAVFLLGNIAKLAWAFGREKDTIQHMAYALARARTTGGARGHALDLIGRDLAVPRFPPRPHAVDDDTIFLLHLDDTAVGGEFADAVTIERPPGHPADNLGAQSVQGGRFGAGVELGRPGGLRIEDHPSLDVGPGDSMTIEFFVRPTEEATGVSILAAKAFLDAGATLNGPGWSLALGQFRGVPNNLRWALADMVTGLEVFADRSLVPGIWHHVAGTVDRAAGRAVLFIDGAEVAAAQLGTIASLANARNLEIGGIDLGGTPTFVARALVDEIRLSGVARGRFGPVTGEDDDAYRRRLSIFRRWWRPSPEGLTEALNRAGPVAGDPAPFVIDETDTAVGVASAALRVLPDEVPTGRSIDGDGRFDTPPPSAEETEFQAWMLTTPSAPNLLLGIGDARLMQVGTARRVEALAELTISLPDALQVLGAFEPAEEGPSSVGRSVVLRHPELAPPRLAVLAHDAGFDHVAVGGDAVTASQGAGPRLDIIQEAGGSDAVDLEVGDRVPFRLDPQAPGARAQWSVIPGTAGRAVLRAHPSDAGVPDEDAAREPRISLEAVSAGVVALRGELERGGLSISAVRMLRIGLDVLADQSEVDAEGRIAPAGSLPEPSPPQHFDPRFLHVWEPLARFGEEPSFGDAEQRRMLFPLRQRLETLLLHLQAAGLSIADLNVLRGFEQGGAEPAFAEGRAVELSHASVTPDRLAAMAHNAGAPLVRHLGGVLTVICEGAPLLGIEASANPGVPDSGRLTLGTSRDLTLSLPDDGGGRDIIWQLTESVSPPVTVNARTRPEVTLTPQRPGRLGLRAVMALRTEGMTQPFTFSVRLKPSLDVPGTVIPKEVYDVAMNVLSHFGPIGVMIDTAGLRARVAELGSPTLSQLPRYTFPDFKDR